MKLKNPLRNVFPFNWFGDLIRFAFGLVGMARKNVRESIRLQLIGTFVVCFLASLLFYSITRPFFDEFNRSAHIDYESGLRQIDLDAQYIVSFTDRNTPVPLDQLIAQMERTERNSPYKIMIVDLEGKVLYKNRQSSETQVDIHSLLSNAMRDRFWDGRSEATSFYPLNLLDQKSYLVVSGFPSPNIYYSDGSSPLPVLFSIAVFLFLFFWFTKKKMRYIEEISSGLTQISTGRLETRVAKRSDDELGLLAGNINDMAEALQRTIEEERRAERTKNELITNVSHDLRTPLTLIMGYLRLLKDKNYESPQQADSYLNIAYTKSEKLKRLIEDLFEYTKLSNSGSRLQQERVCLNELLEQLLEELVTYAEENRLGLVRDLPLERLMVTIDADKMIRVFENLLTNAVKYSHKPGSIRVTLRREGGYAYVCVANYGDAIPHEELPRLFDRFYRADASRSSENGGGSGLGLAIAKSIVESHDGRIWAEADGGEIRFCVQLKLE